MTSELLDNDDILVKPIVANLYSDDTTRPMLGHDKQKLPFEFKQNNGTNMKQADCFLPREEWNNRDYHENSLLYGKIATGYEMEQEEMNEANITPPIVNTMKSILTRSESKQLPSIAEETHWDMQLEKKASDYVSAAATRKKRLGRVRKYRDKQFRIEQIVKHGQGIYRGMLRMQDDSGANRSVTNCKSLLVAYQDIQPYAIGGVKDGDPAIHCTGMGYLPWYSDDDELFLVRCYYCAQVAGTIMSPNDFVTQYQERFHGWNFHANMRTGQGQLTLLSDNGDHSLFTSYKENNLWYHYITVPTTDTIDKINRSEGAVINTMTRNTEYELWHNRLGHPGEKVMSLIHKHVLGVPTLRKHDFHRCEACMAAKMKKVPIGKSSKVVRQPISEEMPSEPGQHLHMDFGFVRGSDWAEKDDDGKLITSIDKYRSYLLIIDRATRYIWVFLTKTKEPPVAQAKGILEKFKGQYRYCTVTTDLGKELGKSKAFQKMVSETGYIMKTTGAHSSAQNGLAEKPNQDLARMMRSMLYGAGLGSKYWSYALRHAVYLKNRLPHSSLAWCTPYEKFNGCKPDLSKLKTFGSRVLIHNGKRKAKLDDISSVGTFLTYKGTNKIMYVRDRHSNEERIATHAAFDEAFMAESTLPVPPMAKALQRAGMKNLSDAKPTPIATTSIPTMKVKRLKDAAIVPKRASATAAGLDIYSAQEAVIPPQQQCKLSTGIAVEIPPSMSGQLQIRSSLALKHQIDLKAGLIDSDYRGEIFVILYNNGKNDFKVDCGDRIAQMVLHNVPAVEIEVNGDLSETVRDDGGFGSTGKKDIKQRRRVRFESDQDSLATIRSLSNVTLSDDPFMDVIEVSISNTGKHPTLGLQLKESDQWYDTVEVEDCKRATPAAKVHRWRTRLKKNTILAVNGREVTTASDVAKIFSECNSNDQHTLRIGLQERLSMNDDDGVPMLYFDQLQMVGKHLDDIKYDRHDNSQVPNPEWHQDNAKEKVLVNMMRAYVEHGTINAAKATIPRAIIPKGRQKASKLTRRKLKMRDDWNDWLESERKQLDQYEAQDTFGEPCKLPVGANVLDLLWAYVVKDDGRKKARCVCNGKPSNKNTAIFGYTYAKALDQVGSRVFWAAAAAKNMIVRGADASNAFAEADAPKIPLYVRVDQPFREWYTHKYPNKPPLSKDCVLPVKKALQGHPESPRSWATLINTILTKKLKFRPTSHEPCLYHGTFKGKEVLFLRQVDDFAVACKEESVTKEVIAAINKEMTIEVKDLGRLDRYNGVDVTQSKHFVKLSNATYIKKIKAGHESWLQHQKPISNKPIPMHSENEYIRRLESATPPADHDQQRALQLRMGINYRQAIGELIYAMVSCRPDISFPLIKLSQYSNNPAQEHYEAVKHLLQYLFATPEDGLYYWRETEHDELPALPFPINTPTTYKPDEATQPDHPTRMHAAVDADWAGDTNHRRSITGITLRLAGGTIFYKSKYQQTIATSSTEAEFTAACDAGKAILYVRSILEEIMLPQQAATVLFIDNHGALMMGNAQQPTRRTRHMDIKQFVLIDWIEHDLLTMKRISTSDNYSDTMTKQVGRVLHYRHFDYILGRIQPKYTKFKMQVSPFKDQLSVHSNMGGI